MSRARVFAEPIWLIRHGQRTRTVYRWAFEVHSGGSVVMADNGFATMQLAFEKAHALALAATLVENRGHRLRPWRELVDEAQI